ncbi:MAG: hypothetical protein NTX50_05485 [Candidatus Sumerlaeota bacterium]|nr:hypothetical protein [Candidatus Sumerlaeota bacterium]
MRLADYGQNNVRQNNENTSSLNQSGMALCYYFVAHYFIRPFPARQDSSAEMRRMPYGGFDPLCFFSQTAQISIDWRRQVDYFSPACGERMASSWYFAEMMSIPLSDSPQGGV